MGQAIVVVCIFRIREEVALLCIVVVAAICALCTDIVVTGVAVCAVDSDSSRCAILYHDEVPYTATIIGWVVKDGFNTRVVHEVVDV